MPVINVWIGLRDDAMVTIKERLDWDEDAQGPYTGPVTDRQAKLFGYMQGHSDRVALFNNPNLNANVWYLWTIDFDLEGDTAQLVKDELDQLLIDYPNHVIIAGAWHWDGRQVGTQWTDGTETATTGTPTYPINEAQLLKFMPDIWSGGGPNPGDGEPVSTPATVLTDVNMVWGQSPRRFT